MTEPLLIATGLLGIAIAVVLAVLLWRERQALMQQKMLARQERQSSVAAEKASLQIAQILTFRDGGVDAAIAKHRQLYARLVDEAPELMSDPDIQEDMLSVGQFLARLTECSDTTAEPILERSQRPPARVYPIHSGAMSTFG